jgi:hypothetical protein
MKIRYYDRSGELLKGYFFQLEIPFDTDLWLRMDSDSKQWIVSDQTTTVDSLQAWAEVCLHAEERRDCPLDASHVTRYEGHSVSWTDLHGGDHLADFVRDSIGTSIVATEAFSRRLLDSGLQGLALTGLPIRFSQASLPETPRLCRLDFKGHDCVRPMFLRLPEPNECPRCHWGPVICPACSDTTYVCPQCGLELIGWTNKPHERPFTAEIINDTDFIIEAHEWDGSDFFAERYITRRALQYLVSVHATPFVAKPCWANVERLTNSQLSALRGM